MKNTVNLHMKEVMNKVTTMNVYVKVKGLFIYKIRLFIAINLMRLAAYIIWASIDIKEVTNEKKSKEETKDS